MNVVHTESAPRAIGPYSQAIVANGFVFCSGQVALDPTTGLLDSGTTGSQTRRALTNLKAVLEAAGSSLQRVVKTTVYLRSMEDFSEMNAVYAEFFGTHAPARATIGVSGLPKDAHVEIDAIATV